MSGDTDATPRTQRFRGTARRPALSADQKRRQAEVTAAAWRHFRTGPAMIAFLNGEDPGLGGRPLDVALDSDGGLAAVLATLVNPGATPGAVPGGGARTEG